MRGDVHRKWAKSDENGVFEVDELADGEHLLTLSHPDYYFAGNQEQLVFAVPFERGVTIDVKMLPAGKIDGRISNLPEYDFDRTRYLLSLTAIGEFHQESLQPGRYRVRLSLNVIRQELGELEVHAGETETFNADSS